MTAPYANTATAKLIADRIRVLSHRKTQAKIASEAALPNPDVYVREAHLSLFARAF